MERDKAMVDTERTRCNLANLQQIFFSLKTACQPQSRWPTTIAAMNLTNAEFLSFSFFLFLFSLFWTPSFCMLNQTIVHYYGYSLLKSTIRAMNTQCNRPCTLRLARFYQLNQFDHLNVRYFEHYVPYIFPFNSILTGFVVNLLTGGSCIHTKNTFLCHCKQHHWSSDKMHFLVRNGTTWKWRWV